MKILLLNPQIDAGHKIVQTLRTKGVVFLFPADSTEAWQMLQMHGQSIDIAIIHREGVGPKQVDAGLEFVSKVKASSEYSDLPMILTSDGWGDRECSKHQASPDGVNAYLRAPFSTLLLTQMIEAVLGTPIVAAPAKPGAPATAPRKSFGNEGGLELQDLSTFFSAPEPERSGSSIKFDAPDLPPEIQSTAKPAQPPEAPLEDSLTHGAGIQLSPIADAPEPAPVAKIHIPTAAEMDALLDQPATGVSLMADMGTPPPPQDTAPMTSLELKFTGMISPSAEGMPEPPVAEEAVSSAPLDDTQASMDMPYLFNKGAGGGGGGERGLPSFNPSLAFAEPVGDAVVPGGAAQAPDLETFKKYLLLREQDVAVLSMRLKAAHDQITQVDQSMREERARSAELSHIVNEQKQKIEDFEKEKLRITMQFESEIRELTFQIKAKTDKARVFESQVQQTSEEVDHLKDRVRTDIRKIRVREKELENRLEIMKKDSEALLGARENKIIELKRKLDLLEFNTDLLQDQYAREKEKTASLRERLNKASQIVKVAGGLLENSKSTGGDAQAGAEGEETRLLDPLGSSNRQAS